MTRPGLITSVVESDNEYSTRHALLAPRNLCDETAQ
jgi:hypothetical protein